MHVGVVLSRASSRYLFRQYVGAQAGGVRNFSDITIASKPKASGNGPFIELPRFEPIGSPSKLLNITLPSSSLLNIRSGSMVAIDGDLHELTSQTKHLTSQTQYEELRTTKAASIVVNGIQENYSVIDIASKNERWYIVKDQSIVAWTGFDLAFVPSQLVDKTNSYETSGKGTIVVSSETAMVEIKLEAHEQMLVSPNSLVATSTKPQFHVLGSQPGAIEVLWKSLLSWWPRSWKVPVSAVRTQWEAARHSLAESTGIRSTEIPHYWEKLKHAVKRGGSVVVSGIFRTKPIYVSVTGPARLLVNSNPVVPNGSFFTSGQIKRLYKHQS